MDEQVAAEDGTAAAEVVAEGSAEVGEATTEVVAEGSAEEEAAAGTAQEGDEAATLSRSSVRRGRRGVKRQQHEDVCLPSAQSVAKAAKGGRGSRGRGKRPRGAAA